MARAKDNPKASPELSDLYNLRAGWITLTRSTKRRWNTPVARDFVQMVDEGLNALIGNFERGRTAFAELNIYSQRTLADLAELWDDMPEVKNALHDLDDLIKRNIAERDDEFPF